MMSNYFQNYYQGKKYKAEPGKSLNGWTQDAVRTPSDKQLKYYSNLIAFLKEKGIPVSGFERIRNRADCRSKISAMITVLEKNGLDAEFYGRAKEE